MAINIFSKTCDEFTQTLKCLCSISLCDARTIYRDILNKGDNPQSIISRLEISTDTATRLISNLVMAPLECSVFEDGPVRKVAVSFHDTCMVESVIIPSNTRTTLCVSSQVGCRMGCSFCATGATGFTRNLLAEEIVCQVYIARHRLQCTIDNIVFMGMGEPFDNCENVIQAIRIMSDQRGLNIPQSHITVSTAGHVDGLDTFAQANLPNVHIAVSINAPADALRNKLMPINKQYPLDDLKKCLQTYPLRKKGLFFIEYVLIEDVNDSHDMAQKLCACLKGLPVRINLIPYNQGGPSTYQAPSQENVKQFAQWLVKEKMFVRVRQSYGNGIMAACGQLRTAMIRNEGLSSARTNHGHHC